MSGKLLSIEEAAERANISTQSMRRHINNGVGPEVTRIGHLLRIRPEKMEMWLDRYIVPQSAPPDQPAATA